MSDIYLLGHEFLQNPHAAYAVLRTEYPVTPVVTQRGLRAWLVTRHADARELLADRRLHKNGRRAKFSPTFTLHMLNADPPDHMRLRGLVSAAFNARPVAALRPRIEEIAAKLLDAMAKEPTADLVDAFAFPLSISVISEVLGVSTAQQTDFRYWSNMLLSENSAGHTAVETAVVNYLSLLINAKRVRPLDDMLTALVRACDDERTLSYSELISMVFLLLVAGHETTVNLITNSTLALLHHPGERELLSADFSILPDAIEEFLRYDGPVNLSTLRHTTERMTVNGTEIPAGDFVLVSLASANRDPHRYAQPERLDITRRDSNLAFGHGIHYCLGAALARLEAEIALGALFRRFPSLNLDIDPARLHWRDSLMMRGVVSLPVRSRH